MKIKIVLNNFNLGFCAGNNMGLLNARGEYVVFLNNDTFVEPDWLEHLVKVLDSHLSVGACQSKILFAQTKEVQTLGNLLDIYGWSLGIRNKQNGDIINQFFYASGASVIVRKSVLDACTGFDELVFSGDYDLGWRIRLYGYEVVTSNKSICYHYGSFATRITSTHPEQYYEACKERIYVLFKNYSFSRILLRIPISIMLMFFASIIWCKKAKKNYLNSVLRAVTWNLRNLKILLTKRVRVQRERKVSDSDIEKFMSYYPLMIFLAKVA
jgi:GT2 family glycosyltransferase